MSKFTDSAGIQRIAHDSNVQLDPCKCKPNADGVCCVKKYCPCKKAGYFCGSACSCMCSDLYCANQVSVTTKEMAMVENNLDLLLETDIDVDQLFQDMVSSANKNDSGCV